MRGLLVSFEGPDRVGKSTQVDLAVARSRAAGQRAAKVKFPRYDKPVGKLIRRMLDDGSAVSYPNLFQVLQWIDKAAFQAFEMGRLLRDNDIVILDRWHASMAVYGRVSGASERLTSFLVATLREPTAVLVMRAPPKARDGVKDAYEADSELQAAVARRYVLWSHAHGDVAHDVDAEGTIEEVCVRVDEAILEAEEGRR